MIHFTAFHGTSNLQSSVNSDAALGTTTLAVIYGSLILSNIFLPSYVIRWLGCKWTMAVSFIAYMPFIAAQFYPHFYTLIPAALGVGFGGGPLWCAKCTFLTIVAEAMSNILDDTSKQVLVVRFFGLFFVFYQMAQVWGNLISSLVLSFDTNDSASDFLQNATINVDEETMKKVGEICGARFCPGVGANENPNLIPPPPEKIQMLSGIFLGCMLLAVLLIVFLVDSQKRYGVRRGRDEGAASGCKLLASTVRLLSEKYQLLLLPITMFIGAEEAFVAVDFTASFVACGWGISRIGYVMICFGVANAIAAGLAGALAKLLGRIPITIAVFVLHASLLVWMHEWIAVANDYMTYCIMAALWGIADGVWLVNVNALSGILFPGKEIAAFSNFKLWEAVGSVLGYVVSPMLCTYLKLRCLLGLMTVGVIGYCTIEYIEKKEKGNINRDHTLAVFDQEPAVQQITTF
ncbi:unnamed protein product [Hermetia illucens]|uniref:UNC93-like protein n=2 Tax=Hermetia illucens TaxID=343691 RepID=A0A7R8YXV0_HERIL|nr:unnamed protein product [Hermetia illucens]